MAFRKKKLKPGGRMASRQKRPLLMDSEQLKHQPILKLGSFCSTDECKYKKEPWQDCDPVTKLQRRRLVLKKGNPACEATKEMTRSCKAKAGAQVSTKKVTVCRYKKGTWSDCDNHTGLKTRTDSLKFNRHAQPEQTRLIRENCEPTRVMTRKCKATKLGSYELSAR